MPYAKDSYTGDGSTTDFVITFPYIEASHVVVKVDGITKTNPDDYTFTTDPQKIRFSTAPASGAVVLLVRSTSQTARLVDYQSGAVLSEEILDNDSLQAFYLTQEVWDIAEEGSIAVGTTTTSAAGGNASVVNAGTAANAILNFTIPRGPTGPTGLTGATGPAGTNGANGADGADGADGVFTAIASQAEAEAGTDNTKGMTPLRVKQANTVVGSVIEELNSLCNTTSLKGRATIEVVTAVQNLTTTYADVSGSKVSAYTCPAGTSEIVYELNLLLAGIDATPMTHWRLYYSTDGSSFTEVTKAKTNCSVGTFGADKLNLRWVFKVNAASDDSTVGQFSAATPELWFKWQARNYTTAYEAKLHETNYFDGLVSSQFSLPSISVKAIA